LVRVRLSENDKPFCTFLIRAPDRAARCGLGEGRPATCRSFPAQLVDNKIEFETSGCTCDWSSVAPDEDDVELLRGEERARDRYADVVATWNGYVAKLTETGALTHQDFCRYLMDAYSP